MDFDAAMKQAKIRASSKEVREGGTFPPVIMLTAFGNVGNHL